MGDRKEVPAPPRRVAHFFDIGDDLPEFVGDIDSRPTPGSRAISQIGLYVNFWSFVFACRRSAGALSNAPSGESYGTCRSIELSGCRRVPSMRPPVSSRESQ